MFFSVFRILIYDIKIFVSTVPDNQFYSEVVMKKNMNNNEKYILILKNKGQTLEIEKLILQSNTGIRQTYRINNVSFKTNSIRIFEEIYKNIQPRKYLFRKLIKNYKRDRKARVRLNGINIYIRITIGNKKWSTHKQVPKEVTILKCSTVGNNY